MGGHQDQQDEQDQQERRGRGAAGAVGAVAAAGAAATGAQVLLGMDVAEAAVEGEGAASVVPLGDVPTPPAGDVDLAADAAAFVADDARVMADGHQGLAEPLDPLADVTGQDPEEVGDAFAMDAQDEDLDGGLDDPLDEELSLDL